jgi:methylated-DNA-[protein]-cysteine S-methyltransferase
MTIVTRSVPSPVGSLLLVGDGVRLTGLFMTRHSARAGQASPGRAPSFDGSRDDEAAFAEAVRQLGEWFEGRRQTFDLEVAPCGSTFQLHVWGVLREISYGETMTYGEVARRVGRPGSARAIGSAVGRNPVGIVIPCHRVVGAGGALTGYAGGLDRKRWLLEHERAHAGTSVAERLFPVDAVAHQSDGSSSSPEPKK